MACVGEVPLLQQLQSKFGEQVAFVGVSLYEEVAAVDRMVAEKGISWPQLWDGKVTEGEIPRLYAVRATPAHFLIDKEGNIGTRLGSAAELQERLRAVVAGEPVEDFSGPRDRWQRPAEVMEALGVKAGSAVADIGSGDGYFTFHLARRAGRTGKVYAVDLDEKELGKLRVQADKMRLGNIEAILGKVDDPLLPESGLDAVLIVNAYHEFTAYDEMLQAIFRALRPGGLLGILERHAELGETRKQYGERHELPGEILIEDAVRNGFRVHSLQPNFAKQPSERQHYYYYLVVRKPGNLQRDNSPGCVE